MILGKFNWNNDYQPKLVEFLWLAINWFDQNLQLRCTGQLFNNFCLLIKCKLNPINRKPSIPVKPLKKSIQIGIDAFIENNQNSQTGKRNVSHDTYRHTHRIHSCAASRNTLRWERQRSRIQIVSEKSHSKSYGLQVIERRTLTAPTSITILVLFTKIMHSPNECAKQKIISVNR